METTTLTTGGPVRTATRDLSLTIRRWTRDLGHLRTRALRLKRDPGAPDAPVDAALDEAIGLCTQLLQDLAGADMEIQRAVEEMRSLRRQADYLFDRQPTPCLGTDDQGRISRANRAAALLLNVSARHLADQPLLHFTQDRHAFLNVLYRMQRDRTPLQCRLTIRPLERGAIEMMATVMPRTPDEASEWLWFLEPVRTDAARLSPRRRSAVDLAALDDSASAGGEVAS